jgi:hypothetical protein
MHTKAEALQFAIAFALRSVKAGRNRLCLTEEDRYKVADDTIKEMRRYGQWRDLDDPLPEPPCGLTGQSKYPKKDAAG